jgi:hypothetical protein
MNTPDHYLHYPPGFFAPAIEYARPMLFSQANAMKYLMRLGKKDTIEADIVKCVDYLEDALDHGTHLNVLHLDGYPRIDPNITHQSKAGFYLALGRLDVVLKALDHFGTRILERR